MGWTLQYRRAFAAIGDQHTIDAMKNCLQDPEFGFDAAHVLKAVWRETQPPQDESGLLKSWPDFSVVPEEYRKRQSVTTEETHPFVDDIIASINALIEPGAPEADLLHALKLATVAFSMPYTGKEDTIDALLRLSVPVVSKQELLTVLVLSGKAISSELVLRGIDDLLEEAKANPWMLQEQDGWRMMDWLRLLPFTDRPAAVLKFLIVLKASAQTRGTCVLCFLLWGMRDPPRLKPCSMNLRNVMNAFWASMTGWQRW